jgi:hypothetical protein
MKMNNNIINMGLSNLKLDRVSKRALVEWIKYRNMYYTTNLFGVFI